MTRNAQPPHLAVVDDALVQAIAAQVDLLTRLRTAPNGCYDRAVQLTIGSAVVLGHLE